MEDHCRRVVPLETLANARALRSVMAAAMAPGSAAHSLAGAVADVAVTSQQQQQQPNQHSPCAGPAPLFGSTHAAPPAADAAASDGRWTLRSGRPVPWMQALKAGSAPLLLWPSCWRGNAPPANRQIQQASWSASTRAATLEQSDNSSSSSSSYRSSSVNQIHHHAAAATSKRAALAASVVEGPGATATNPQSTTLAPAPDPKWERVRLTRHMLTTTESAISGAVAGAVARCAIAPLDVLKIRFQLQLEPAAGKAKYTGILQALRLIVREEGISALWKGNLTAELLYMAYGASQFAFFHSYKSMILTLQYGHMPVGERGTELDPVSSFVGGALAGMLATVVSFPFDTMRTRLASQGEPRVYRSLFHAAQMIALNDGLRGFYKGLVPGVIQIFPYMGLQFCFYESSKRTFRWILNPEHPQHVNLSQLQVTACGAVAGALSKFTVLPLDIVKKRLQVQGFEEPRFRFGRQQTYLGMRNAMQIMLAQEGVRGFFKGGLPSVLKSMPSTAITFAVYEWMCTWFANRHVPE
ncbi:thiamine pyrophosphate carrier 1 protein [Capsaspora owczarzaki ATCC 30864]|nr:thiamine pyrophosphate carrier 1 protein [Capsaspora owczarzaki ATCC 30864]|eukprot:XP_004342772.1 thiamine pyrophosphate carrier 1 protein [Capsaspora owczarzaki ATCC 30864]